MGTESAAPHGMSLHPSIHPSVHPAIRPASQPTIQPSVHPSHAGRHAILWVRRPGAGKCRAPSKGQRCAGKPNQPPQPPKNGCTPPHHPISPHFPLPGGSPGTTPHLIPGCFPPQKKIKATPSPNCAGFGDASPPRGVTEGGSGRKRRMRPWGGMLGVRWDLGAPWGESSTPGRVQGCACENMKREALGGSCP